MDSNETVKLLREENEFIHKQFTDYKRTVDEACVLIDGRINAIQSYVLDIKEEMKALKKENEILRAHLGPFPPGWYARVTTDGKIYYINHDEKRTSWTLPEYKLGSQTVEQT